MHEVESPTHSQTTYRFSWQGKLAKRLEHFDVILLKIIRTPKLMVDV